MIAIAVGTFGFTAAGWLIVGDGGYDVQLVNGLGKPIRHVRVVSDEITLATDELNPGAELHGRFRAKRFSREDMLQSDVEVSYRLDGEDCRTHPGFGISMITMQPIARMTIVDHFGEGVIELSDSSPRISGLKSRLRSWWFWLFHG